MVSAICLTAYLAVTIFSGLVVSHPGESDTKVKRELKALRTSLPVARRAINSCATAPGTTALKARSITRRATAAEKLRKERGITSHSIKSKRGLPGFNKWAGVDHDVSSLGFGLDTPLGTIFDSNSTCALVPESDLGPYFVGGELIRSDVTDDEPGVPLHLDLQFIDVETCEPIPASTLVDIWACNSTGVYSGITSGHQGGLNTTYLRGVQSTDEDGTVQFDTIFPGHYPGRATHIHLLITHNATLLPNKTYVTTSGTPSHIGQLFFDQDLISEVEALAPYNTNKVAITPNAKDFINVAGATVDYDPFVDYVRLGESLEDGLLAFITVFVNTAANVTAARRPAAQYYEGGGVPLSPGFNFTLPPGFNGTFPPPPGSPFPSGPPSIRGGLRRWLQRRGL
ncbi:Intradiol ring-cleavage dioxygenase [Xylariaceae sp. FL1019]|nr:Intradiol ring-cleavage dioxygenase [Xylariaceae sp. FL1019]